MTTLGLHHSAEFKEKLRQRMMGNKYGAGGVGHTGILLTDEELKRRKNLRAKKWRENNLERDKANRLRFYKKNREIILQRCKTSYRDRRRAYVLGYNHGISADDYEKMFLSQGGVCAVCKNPPTGKGIEVHLHVDHDHSSGSVRGLLCGRCNKALGLLKDNPDSIMALYLYLESYLQLRDGKAPTKSI